MFIMKNHGFKRKYVYGGSGIFGSLASFLGNLFTSGVAKQLTSTAIDVGKEVGKRTAVDVGTRLVKKVLTPKVQVEQKRIQKGIQKAPAVSQRVAPAVAAKVQDILNKYVVPQVPQVVQAPVRQNINSLIDGSGNNAVAIQDLVRRLHHGNGLKTT